MCRQSGGCPRVLTEGEVTFVPEGLNDSSLTVYCLECARKMSPSRRDRLICAARFSISGPANINHTVPNGTERFFYPSPAVNCQATIDQSLRNENIWALKWTPIAGCRTRSSTLTIERKAIEESLCGETYSLCGKCPAKKEAQTADRDRRRLAHKILIPEHAIRAAH
jgi:hypothetical protein